MIYITIIIILICFCIFLLYENYQMKKTIKRVNKEMSEMSLEHSTGRKILINQNNPFSQIVFSINKIIDKKNIEIEKLKLSEKAHKSLLTSLAHDLRTPLTTLIGYLEAIDINLNKEKNTEYLQIALGKAKQLKENVNQIFEWSKLYSNTEDLKLKKIDLSELTRTILIDWIPIFEKKNINYNVDIPDGRVNGYIDEISYHTIINNLIKNVIEHANAGNVEVKLFQKEDKIIFEISDDGVGIEEKVKEKIFEKFYKGSRSRGNRGSGLGLSIVKLLVEKQNGEISVDTEVNRGTTFKIAFPQYITDKPR